MKDFLTKTFGGLSLSYYLRQLFFAAVILVAIYFLIVLQNTSSSTLDAILTAFGFTILALIYPYARFIVDLVGDFVIGDNIIITSIPLMLAIKLIVMGLTLAFAVFIAPIGLLYLYFYHRRQEKKLTIEGES